MGYEVPQWVNGELITQSARQLNLMDPLTGELLGKVLVADRQVVDQAVMAAHHALPAWKALSVPERMKIMFRFKALLDQHIKELAKLVTREHGKTLAEAIGSVQRGIDVVDFVCGLAAQLKGSFAKEVATGVDCYSIYQPVGVCVGITPFNFPAMIPLWMFPMAIACGNTFVLKPSEKDPSCALKLVQLAEEAGIPKGVVNVVQGDAETVSALITHPEVKAVSFVGSSLVAESVYQTATAHHKRVQAFGGAKNHCLVMPDADLNQAAKAIVTSAYGSAGERCMAISVVVAVGDQVADQLIEKMRPLIANIKLGPGSDPNTEMGPLITAEHLKRVRSYIEIGKQEGAVLIIDGSNDQPKSHPHGLFLGPSLFDYVKPSMRIYREEIFGPVLVIVRVKSFQEGLALVNQHDYGNGSAIYTRDGYTARTFAEQVETGMVGVNVPVPVPVAYQSFGGWKRSIFSDIGMYGIEGVRFYTQLKTITERWYP